VKDIFTLNHIVLLFSLHPVLRAKGAGKPDSFMQ